MVDFIIPFAFGVLIGVFFGAMTVCMLVNARDNLDETQDEEGEKPCQ